MVTKTLRDYIGKWIHHGMVSPPLFLVDVISEKIHMAEVIAIDMMGRVWGYKTLYPTVRLSEKKDYHEVIRIIFEGEYIMGGEK